MSQMKYLLILITLTQALSEPKNLIKKKYSQPKTEEEFLKSMGVPIAPLKRKLLEEETTTQTTTTTSEDSKIINVKCLWAHKYDMYSLQTLQNKEKDYEVAYGEGKVIFNLCQNTITKYNNSASESTALYEDTPGHLVKISGSIEGEGEIKNVWNELIEDDETGVIIHLVDGEECVEGQRHLTDLKIYCDPEVLEDDFLGTVNLTDFNGGECEHIIAARSFYGCKLNSLYLLKRLFGAYKYPIAVLFIIVGIFLCLFGARYITITVMVTCSFIGSYLLTVLILSFYPDMVNTESRVWLFIGGGLLLGLVAGWYLKGEVRGYVVLLGGVLGYSSATFVYQIVQDYITWDPEMLYYITLGVCCMAGLLLGMCMYKVILTFGTALFGGYVAMRGASFIFGNYLDEQQVMDLIKNKEWEQLKQIRGNYVYAYLGSWALMTVVGTFIQCRYANKKNHKGRNH